MVLYIFVVLHILFLIMVTPFSGTSIQESYSVIKRNECEKTWVNLKCVLLNEIDHSESYDSKNANRHW